MQMLLRQIGQKVDSLGYRLRARAFKRSEAWQRCPWREAPQPTNEARLYERVRRACDQLGVPLRIFTIDADAYGAFRERFHLPFSASLYALGCREKKFMEHHVAYELLGLQSGERYMDIASESSPFPEMLRERMGVEAWSQDLSYPEGIQGYQIGSSADRLPVPDAWLDKASLQCAFEHFEGDIDSAFMRELSRVLRPGGKCVIVPLYMAEEHLNIYDPLLYPDWDASRADEGARIVAEIALGGRFERIYAPERLDRILIPDIGLDYTLYRIEGQQEALAAIGRDDEINREQVGRIRYALLVEKRSD